MSRKNRAVILPPGTDPDWFTRAGWSSADTFVGGHKKPKNRSKPHKKRRPPTGNVTGPGDPTSNYDPSQPRDPGGEGGGQWVKGGAGGGGTAQHPGDKAKGIHGSASQIKSADVDVSRDPDSPPGTRYRKVTRETTHEGVSLKQAKTLTPEQNREVSRWHDGMTMVNKNGKNSRLPDEAHNADYNDYERGALQKYSYKNDGPLNGMLRGKEDWQTLKDANGKPAGEVPYNDDFYKQMDKSLQSAFDKTPVMKNPVTVVRGMNLEGKNLEGFLAKMEAGMASGQSFEMGGYTSTAAPGGMMYKLGLDSGIPKPFRGNISLKINAVHGIDMGPHSQLPGEAELLLDKRSRFVVKSIKKGKNGEYQIEVDQLPPPQRTGA